MTYLAPFLAGLMAGMVVCSFVLHWIAGLAEVINSRSDKSGSQVIREAVIVTFANSGFWILIVTAFVAHHVLSGPLDKPLIIGSVGFLAAMALLGVIAYGFGRGDAGSLLMRFGASMRRKENFMRFGFMVAIIVAAPMLAEWYEQGMPAGFLVFVAVVWAAATYFGLWYMWQFVPWDKPGLTRNKSEGGG